MAEPTTTLSTFKDAAEAIAACVTAIGIVLGGGLYLMRRQRYPRADVTHRIEHHLLVDEAENREVQYVRVKVAIENRGEVIIKIDQGFTRVQQVLPLDPSISDKISDINTLLTQGNQQVTRVPWPLLPDGQRDYNPRQPCEIEPGEIQELDFDFFLDSGVRVIAVYTHLVNKKKLFRFVGWTTTSVYDLRINPKGGSNVE